VQSVYNNNNRKKTEFGIGTCLNKKTKEKIRLNSSFLEENNNNKKWFRNKIIHRTR